MFLNLPSPTGLSGFYVVFDGSTNLEATGTRGASHLVEHLVCRSFKDMRDELDRHGIEWNATTTANYVVFYFTGLESSIKKYRGKLLDRIYDFRIEKSDFESERKIVLEEYSDTFSRHPARHMLNTYRKHLNSHMPIGSREDLQDLRWIDLLGFYEKNFMRPTKVISVSRSGKFGSSSVDFSDGAHVPEYHLAEYKNKLEPAPPKKEKSSIIVLSSLMAENLDKLRVLSMVIGKGLGSPLYQEVRERLALCYTISSDVDRFGGQAIMKIQTSTQSAHADKALSAIKKILRDPSKHVTKRRVDLIVDLLKAQEMKGEINRYKNVDRFIDPEHYDIYRDLKKVTRKSVLDAFETAFASAEPTVSVD